MLWPPAQPQPQRHPRVGTHGWALGLREGPELPVTGLGVWGGPRPGLGAFLVVSPIHGPPGCREDPTSTLAPHGTGGVPGRGASWGPHSNGDTSRGGGTHGPTLAAAWGPQGARAGDWGDWDARGAARGSPGGAGLGPVFPAPPSLVCWQHPPSPTGCQDGSLSLQGPLWPEHQPQTPHGSFGEGAGSSPTQRVPGSARGMGWAPGDRDKGVPWAPCTSLRGDTPEPARPHRLPLWGVPWHPGVPPGAGWRFCSSFPLPRRAQHPLRAGPRPHVSPGAQRSRGAPVPTHQHPTAPRGTGSTGTAAATPSASHALERGQNPKLLGSQDPRGRADTPAPPRPPAAGAGLCPHTDPWGSHGPDPAPTKLRGAAAGGVTACHTCGGAGGAGSAPRPPRPPRPLAGRRPAGCPPSSGHAEPPSPAHGGPEKHPWVGTLPLAPTPAPLTPPGQPLPPCLGSQGPPLSIPSIPPSAAVTSGTSGGSGAGAHRVSRTSPPTPGFDFWSPPRPSPSARSRAMVSITL